MIKRAFRPLLLIVPIVLLLSKPAPVSNSSLNIPRLTERTGKLHARLKRVTVI